MPWFQAGAAVASSHIAADAQGKAAQQAAQGVKKGKKFQEQAYHQQQAQMAPWRQYGGGALAKLGQYYGLGGMSGGNQQPTYTYKDKHIQKWLDNPANQGHPRYQEVASQFQSQGAPQGTPQGAPQSAMGMGFAPGAMPYGMPAQQPVQNTAQVGMSPQQASASAFRDKQAQSQADKLRAGIWRNKREQEAQMMSANPWINAANRPYMIGR